MTAHGDLFTASNNITRQKQPPVVWRANAAGGRCFLVQWWRSAKAWKVGIEGWQTIIAVFSHMETLGT